jgi:hypothetical protein
MPGMESIEATAESTLYNGGSLWAEYWTRTIIELRDRLIASGELDDRSIDTFLGQRADREWWTQTIALTTVHARAPSDRMTSRRPQDWMPGQARCKPWARLVSNQRPLACEAIPGPRWQADSCLRGPDRYASIGLDSGRQTWCLPGVCPIDGATASRPSRHCCGAKRVAGDARIPDRPGLCRSPARGHRASCCPQNPSISRHRDPETRSVISAMR